MDSTSICQKSAISSMTPSDEGLAGEMDCGMDVKGSIWSFIFYASALEEVVGI